MSKTSGSADQVEGEGSYTAAEEYDQAARDFVQRGKVKKAAQDAAPEDAREARELEEAEKEGLAHARSEKKG